jgi:hypothetical protein
METPRMPWMSLVLSHFLMAARRFLEGLFDVQNDLVFEIYEVLEGGELVFVFFKYCHRLMDLMQQSSGNLGGGIS